MATKKYFFRSWDDELCYRKEHWFAVMKEEGITELELLAAVPLRDDDFIFCKSIAEAVERGSCGKQCDEYAPRNGKSGCCKHLGKLFEPDEKVVLRLG